MNIGSIMTMLFSLAGTALSAGWPGLIALGVTALGGLLALRWAINHFNSQVDASDQERAGADAGQTAVGLANQADQGRSDLDELEKQSPPTHGEEPQK
jgi:hypothetical protein